MMTKQQTEDIITALQVLPEDKVLQVRDFVLFLKACYERNTGTEESGAWTEEDLRDLSIAVGEYADKAVPWKEAAQ